MTDEQKTTFDQQELRELILKMTPKQLDEYLDIHEKERVLKARENYIDYLRYVYQDEWKDGKHIFFLCDKIEKFLNDELLDSKGRVARFLLLSEPPQHGKSMMLTNTLPSYRVCKYKKDRIALISYGEDLANEFGRENLLKVQEHGNNIFGVELNPTAKAVSDFRISGHRGRVFSRGIQAGITGNAADLIIIDDPLKGEKDSNSEDARNYINREFKKSIVSRLSAKAKVIIIQTRWHDEDLIGKIIKEDKLRYVYYNIPCEALENDILGRKKGEPLFPEIGKDKAWLEEYKEIYSGEEGEQAWESLYQGNPLLEKGYIFEKQWFENIYDELPEMMFTAMSVDASFKGGETSDNVSIQVWGKRNSAMYFIDNVTRRMSFTETIEMIKLMREKHPKIDVIYIEDKANGSAIIDVLSREISGIVPIEPRGGKASRASAITIYFKANNIFLPKEAPWKYSFIAECLKFDGSGKYKDDQVDSMTQCLANIGKFVTGVPDNSIKNSFFGEKRDKNQDNLFKIEIDNTFINYVG